MTTLRWMKSANRRKLFTEEVCVMGENLLKNWMFFYLRQYCMNKYSQELEIRSR